MNRGPKSESTCERALKSFQTDLSEDKGKAQDAPFTAGAESIDPKLNHIFRQMHFCAALKGFSVIS